MPSNRPTERAIGLARSGLATMARQPQVHRVFDLVQRELNRAAFPEEPADAPPAVEAHAHTHHEHAHAAHGVSHAHAAAHLVWRSFPTATHLDVGCGPGHLVAALRGIGIDAWGSDVDGWAVDHSADGAYGRLRRGDLTRRLPYRSGLFDSVSAVGVLEHLPPGSIPHALGELRRVCRGYLLVVDPAHVAIGTGPDAPFTAADFVRLPELEASLQSDLQALGYADAWGVAAFRVSEAAVPALPLRTAEEVRARADDWGLAGLS